MIGFDGVVRVVLHDVARGGQQLIDHPRVGRRPISAHLGGAWAVLEGAGEEPASGRQIPILRDEDVDDLAILVDCPVKIGPAPGDLAPAKLDLSGGTRRWRRRISSACLKLSSTNATAADKAAVYPRAGYSAVPGPSPSSPSLRRSCCRARARVGPIPPGGIPAVRAISV